MSRLKNKQPHATTQQIWAPQWAKRTPPRQEGKQTKKQRGKATEQTNRKTQKEGKRSTKETANRITTPQPEHKSTRTKHAQKPD